MIDAGGPNVDPNYQTFGERHWTHATAPGYNWGYKTVPQEHLEERKLDYSRGKGLGGSTSINFCVYTRGPKADYDRWAQLVEDDTWSWDYVLERFKKVYLSQIASEILVNQVAEVVLDSSRLLYPFWKTTSPTLTCLLPYMALMGG